MSLMFKYFFFVMDFIKWSKNFLYVVVELVKIERFEDYEKDLWILIDDEKL